MKIFLIYARKVREPSNMPPMGILILGALLRQKTDHKVRLFDMGFDSDQEIFDECLKEKPDVIGLSTDSIGYQSGLTLLNKLRGLPFEPRIIVGGVHPSIDPEKTLKETGADLVVMCEGEYTLLEIMERLSSQSSYEDVTGIAFIKNGKFVINQARPFIKELDELPWPDRSLANYQRYLDARPDMPFIYPTMVVMTNRGCKGNCIYCQPVVRNMYGKRMRYRSVDNVISEIAELRSRYDFKSILFNDDDLLFNGKEWLYDFCNKMELHFANLKWACYSRIDQIDDKMARKMSKAGCYAIAFGVESGSQKILNYMRKGYRVEQVSDVFDICRKYGIISTANLMVGTPGDSRDTIKNTANMLIKAKPDLVRVSITTPTPGSDLQKLMLAEDRINLKNLSDYDRWAFYPIRLDGFSKQDMRWAIKRLMGIYYRSLIARLVIPWRAYNSWYFLKRLLLRYLNMARRPKLMLSDIYFYMTYYWQRRGR